MNGVQFGFNDTVQLHDEARVAPRFDHRPDGSFVRREDEAEAQKLLGNQFPGNVFPAGSRHVMKGGTCRIFTAATRDCRCSDTS